MKREEPRNLLFVLEMRLGVRQEITAGFIERLSLANAVENVENGLVVGPRVEHAIRPADRKPVRPCRVEGACDANAIFAVLVKMNGNREPRTERTNEARTNGLGEKRGIGQGPEPRAV